jgi:hypothetical protein
MLTEAAVFGHEGSSISRPMSAGLRHSFQSPIIGLGEPR